MESYAAEVGGDDLAWSKAGLEIGICVGILDLYIIRK